LNNFKREGHEGIQADPIRVVQAVVIGISFLGTGTIIHQSGDRVEGLTTAAGIFFTAAIGIAVAVHHVVLAAGATVLAVIVLVGLGWLEARLQRGSDRKNA
jgi:putative Mg2+ transporter-C (MgtC) family protein